MDKRRAAALLTDNLTAIYGYAFSRLYEKEQAEDLASEILCEILASVSHLREEKAFWGFVWKIAENTFRKFIKREEIRRKAEQTMDTSAPYAYVNSPETDYIDKEEQDEALYLLRRELSLLAKMQREICVAYYVHNKSCSQIANEQNTSVEMVKYHLFKARRSLKEGIGMTRQLGEKSYNPGIFRLNFWGDCNYYSNLCKRKLPGAILLAAYDKPMSTEELSLELGIAMPYLEEEVETLEAAGVLQKSGTNYQTNLVIVTDEYEKAFIKQTAPLYPPTAAQIFGKTMALLPSVRALDFAGNDYDDNRLLFMALNMAMENGFQKAAEQSPIGQPKPLALGGHGWVFGVDNDFVNLRFEGITLETWNDTKTAWFSAINYRAIKDCQHFVHSRFRDKIEAMCDAILGKAADETNNTLPWLIENGFISCTDTILSANFPVFTVAVHKAMCELLSPVSDMVAACMIEVSNKAEAILVNRVPTAVRDQCGDVAKIHHRLDVAGLLMEELIATGKLTVPIEKTPLCVFGVKR